MQRCLFSKRTLRGRSLCFVLEMINQVTPPDTCSVQAPSGGVTVWYQSQGYREPGSIRYAGTITVMAISVISISSDSSEDSVGTPIGRTDTTVIPTETPIIAPTIPPSPDYTPASPDYSPASDSESDPSEDPSSDHIPPLPAISPFLSSADDTTNSDTPDTPPSPTHGTPFTEITSSTQRSPVIPHYFSPDDSAQDSSSDSSSEASTDFHSDASSDSSSRHSLSDHSSSDLPSTFVGPSRKRRRSPMASVPALPHVFGALSPVRADLIPSPKRIRDSGYSADVEVDPRETSLRDDIIVRGSDEPHLEQDIDPEIQAHEFNPVQATIVGSHCLD
ncbi:hypothetical protein Tco_0215823 [Tanacetum coccineum]